MNKWQSGAEPERAVLSALKKAIIFTVIGLFFSTLLVACGGGDDNSTASGDTSVSYRLTRLTTGNNLLLNIQQELIDQYGRVRDYSPLPVADVAESAGAAAGPTASSTNVQEAGVDEADRLKNDGKYLYVAGVDTPKIMVFETGTAVQKLSELTLDTSSDSQPLSGLYQQDSQLIALVSPYYYGVYPIAAAALPVTPATQKTEVFMVDVATPAQPQQTQKIELDGELVSSRMIGSVLYLATRSLLSLPGLEFPADETIAAANRSLIDASQLSDFLPNYSINGIQQGELFSPDDCLTTEYSATTNSLSVISLVTIDTGTAGSRPQGQCFLGDAETLYASASSVYLATTRYSYTHNAEIGVFYSGEVNTDLHHFNLADGSVSYSGSGQVDGHLGWYQDLKPFRMSEHNGVLRVLTFTGDRVTDANTPAHLYTLQTNTGNGDLTMIGELPNELRPEPLGKPGEQVYATRFIGDKAYLVTYRLTDPLYVLDVSNPADPYIAGELEIDGYSDYLHPVGENYLLGVGKDAVVDGGVGDEGRQAWYQGVKLSLIDISNPQSPFEKQTIILGKRGSETAVSQSHHAFTSLQQGDTLQVALPLSRHETVDETSFGSDEGSPQYFYGWTQDELVRSDINTTTGEVTEKASVVAEAAADTDRFAYSAYWSADRSALVDGRVYYLHGDEVLSRDW